MGEKTVVLGLEVRRVEERRGRTSPGAGPPPRLQSKALAGGGSMFAVLVSARGTKAVKRCCCRGAAERSYNHTSGLGVLLKCIKIKIKIIKKVW